MKNTSKGTGGEVSVIKKKDRGEKENGRKTAGNGGKEKGKKKSRRNQDKTVTSSFFFR